MKMYTTAPLSQAAGEILRKENYFLVDVWNFKLQASTFAKILTERTDSFQFNVRQHFFLHWRGYLISAQRNIGVGRMAGSK